MSDDDKLGMGEPNYDVGYGRPPSRTRFKPGQSGNPKGKKKGSRSATTIIAGILNETIQVKTSRGIRKMTKLEAATHATMNEAMKGNRRAFEQLLKMARDVGIVSGVAETIDAVAMEQLVAEDRIILQRYGIQCSSRNGEGGAE